MDRTIAAVKAFNEQPMEAKAKIYRREMAGEMDTGVAFFSNVDLFHSKAASRRDTLQLRLEPKPNMAEMPEVCKNEPDLTIGLSSHTDPGVIAVLMQDQHPGLQVKHGDEWLDAPPVPGALVVNIGDIL
ncbi:1-aminocyclopropane-1-carboxylate oxidase homolog 4-like [Eucalyptus grandis]|uniref:1-aminocyclopropane-1-carboxylate oxidase homolog 4-like n=1 Tax=Eucalyptus grandis TaxID=71139 RepID=UPI00192E912B|nr:1-aminocyclopropane-1-carboxylate oxidase homolog 4-like [Eucalyptus grandis]